MEGWNFWWGIAAFFLGGLATQLNGWLAYRRQRKDRADDAADALQQRREEFELQHLVEVNRLLRAYMETAQAAIHHRLYALALGPSPESRTAQREMLAAERAIDAEVGFILNDRIRQIVAEAVEETAETAMAQHDDTGTVNMLPMAQAQKVAYDAIGARVRELYAGRAGV
jgi:cbb3-type cytochrome oxidase subunit 3